MIGQDHAAIAAGKDQQRHQIGGQARSLEMRLEAEQVRRVVDLVELAGQLARLPRAMRGDDHRRVQHLLFLVRLDPDGLQLAVPLDGDGAPWLKDFGAGRACRVEQQPVQHVASERAAEAALRRACVPRRSTSPPKNPTRRISGPASARHASPMPSRSSKARLVAEMNSPHTLRRGNRGLFDDGDAQPCRASVSRGGRACRARRR